LLAPYIAPKDSVQLVSPHDSKHITIKNYALKYTIHDAVSENSFMQLNAVPTL
jgi:hypothetical protein